MRIDAKREHPEQAIAVISANVRFPESAVVCVPVDYLRGEAMYFTVSGGQTGNSRVYRADLDGNNLTQLFPFGAGGFALDVPRGKLYGIGIGTNGVARANMDGTGVETLVDSPTHIDAPWAVALDLTSDTMYWTDRDLETIKRANLDGSAVTDVFTGLAQPRYIALDVPNQRIYWTENRTIGIQVVRRGDFDGTGMEDLMSGIGRPHGIALDLPNGKVYWTDFLNGDIYRSNLDGSTRESLVSGLDSPGGIALDSDEGLMYWTSATKVQRAKVDGSNVQDLVTNLIDGTGIALDLTPIPEPSSFVILAVGIAGLLCYVWLRHPTNQR